MATEVTIENQNLITALKAKIQVISNKIETLQNAKEESIKTIEATYKLTLKSASATYDTQISILRAELEGIEMQLKVVK